MSLDVNASCSITIHIVLRELFPLEIQNPDYFFIYQGVPSYSHFRQYLTIGQLRCIWLSCSINVRYAILFRIARFIKRIVIHKMPRLNIRIQVHIWVITDEARVTKILTKFVRFNPKFISEQLLNLAIAVAIVSNTIVISSDNYL